MRTSSLSSILPVFVALASCGPPEEPLTLPQPEEAVQSSCAQPNGEYDAVFSLIEAEGSCGRAKQESHDPIAFDAKGKFVPPVPELISCQTEQRGCAVTVRCEMGSLLKARALLEATLSEDATRLKGTSIVEGTYEGCSRVVYAVDAVRQEQLAAPR